jgi:O-antigen ligase
MRRLRFELAVSRALFNQSLFWLLLVVAAYLFIAPNIDLAPDLAWHDGQRIAQIVTLCLIVLFVVFSKAGVAVLDVWADLPRWSRWASGFAFALGCVSASQSVLPRWAFLEVGHLFLLMVAALAVAAARRVFGSRCDEWLILLFFSIALAYSVSAGSVYVVMLLIGPDYNVGFDLRELYTGFSNVRFFGHIQTFLLPFLLLPAMYWGATRTRLAFFVMVPALWWMLAIGSGTRGTWVALLIGIVAALTVGGRPARRWALWQGAGVLCGLICYGIFVMGIPRLFELPPSFLHRAGDIASLSGRDVLWSSAWQFIVNEPWLGIGPMHYAYWAKAVGAHPHNAVLQWLIEWGVPAGVLLTGLWVAGGVAFAAHVRRLPVDPDDDRVPIFHAALLAALAGASAQAMVDGVLVMPVSQILMVLLAGWAIGLMPCIKHPAGKSNSMRGVMIVVVLLAMGAVVYGVSPELGELTGQQPPSIDARNPGENFFPRFWVQGWIGK